MTNDPRFLSKKQRLEIECGYVDQIKLRHLFNHAEAADDEILRLKTALERIVQSDNNRSSTSEIKIAAMLAIAKVALE